MTPSNKEQILLHMRICAEMQEDSIRNMPPHISSDMEAKCFGLARMTLVRCKLYNNSNIEEDRKTRLWNDVKKACTEQASTPKSPIHSDKQHIAIISQICSTISDAHHDILERNRFRFGVGQKIYNMYLKYRWILSYQENPLEYEWTTPPHAPIDGMIVNTLGNADILGHETQQHYKTISPKRYCWTKNDHAEDYLSVINKAKEASRVFEMSLPEWELACWNFMNPPFS